jgi:TonB-dependent starch-binding outer membrane protein SusC
MVKKIANLFTLMLLVISIYPAIGQTGRITGTVTDRATGETLPGASVLVTGTTTGTVTDMDGRYAFDAPVGNITIEASFIGYDKGSMAVSLQEGQTVVANFQLFADIMTLEEFVVIGYGVQKKSDMTGSIASVTAEDLNRGVLTDPIQGMQGKAAGVSVTRRGGDPNAGFDVKIRGAASLNTGTSPLFVIDGVPGVDPTTVSPDDIESFSVLKDASAAAIYGSRGANGVIIITTKRGDKKKGSQIDFNSYVSFDQVARRLDLLSAEQYRQFVNDNPTFGVSFIDLGASTDWQDEVYRTGLSQNYTLSFSGGDETTRYRASVSHMDFNGVVKGSQKVRTIGRINLDQSALDGRLNLSSGISGTIERNDYINYGGWSRDNVLWQTFQRNPTDPIKTDNGDYYEIERRFNYYNPLAIIDGIQNERDAKRLFGFLKADLDIFDGFSAGVNMAYTRNDDESFYFEPKSLYIGSQQGFGRRGYNNFESKVFETTLRYQNDFGLHNIQTVAGYSFQEDYGTGFSAQGRNPALDLLGANNLRSLLSVTAVDDINSFKNSSRLISFFGRGIYNWNNKYFATATVRRDGSSRFGSENKWGIFPSASAMWNITGEDFMTSFDMVNNLRLRVGYGITGNQEFGNNLHRGYYYIAGTSLNFDTREESINIQFSHNANENLKWEENAELNIGLDFGFLNDRISGTVDYFDKRTYDLLGAYSVPSPPNLSTRIYANVGEFKVQGFELFLQSFIVDNPVINWRTTMTFSSYKQDVVNLSNNDFPWSRMQESYLSGPGLVGDLNWTQIVDPGMPLGTWYIPEYAGLSQDGFFLFKTAVGGVTRELQLAERKNMGNAQPTFELGWSNFVTLYRNFDASVALRAVYGHKVFNTTRMILGNPRTSFPNTNALVSAIDEYDRGLRDIPKVSSYYLEDGSFIRIDNISLGYNFRNVPGFSRVRLYFASNNVFTFTKYTGLDPEISTNGLSFGLDQYDVYPRTRTFTFGINASL